MARASTINAPRGGKVTDRSTVAVGYLRRSTDRQEQSIPDQQRACEHYAEEHGLRVLRFYVDDAISGTNTIGRQAFQDLIRDATSSGGGEGGFGIILVYDVKRFGRIDNDEAGYYRHLLRTHGVEVVYISEGFSGDGTDDLLRPVKQWQARQESKDLSKVAIRGLLSKTGSGGGWWMGGVPPLGYDLRYESQVGEFLFILRYEQDGSKVMFNEQGERIRTLQRGESVAVSRRDRCKLVPSEPSRVETVKRIFRLYTVERRGFKAIADVLNRDKIPTARGAKWSDRYSGDWSMTAVRGILINPAYVGDLVWNRRTDARFHRIVDGRAVERRGVAARRMERNDESDWIVIPDAHPPLVSRRTFEAARSQLSHREESRSQRGINPRKPPHAPPTLSTPIHGTLPTGQALGGPEIGANGGWSGPKAKYLLSQLCTCARCGHRYEGHTQYRACRDEQGHRLRDFEYACGGYIRHGRSVCTLGGVPKAPLETLVVQTVLAYYRRYEDEPGQSLLQEVLRDAFVGDQENLSEERRALRKKRDGLQRTIANLLDNITSVNRSLVDARIVELTREQDRLEERLSAIDHMTLSQRHRAEVEQELRAFLCDLQRILRGEAESTVPPDVRQAAIRRCIDHIVIDHAKHEARVAIRQVPVMDASLGRDATETITVNWTSRRRQRAATD